MLDSFVVVSLVIISRTEVITERKPAIVHPKTPAIPGQFLLLNFFGDSQLCFSLLGSLLLSHAQIIEVIDATDESLAGIFCVCLLLARDLLIAFLRHPFVLDFDQNIHYKLRHIEAFNFDEPEFSKLKAEPN